MEQIQGLVSYAKYLEDELVRYDDALAAAYIESDGFEADYESLSAKVQSLEADLASAMAAKIDLETRIGVLEDDLAARRRNRNPSNGRPAGGGSSGTELALKHYVRSTDWSPEEQQILEDGLVEFAHGSSFSRCVKIASQLEGKTIIDVAWRCRLMRERVTDLSEKPSAHLAARPSIPACNPPILPVDNVDHISYKEIGGRTRQLLELNAQIFHQRDANLGNLLTQENLNLLCETRDIVLAILNETNDVPGVMEQMPQHPVRMNHELANSILPRPSNIQS